RRLDPDLGSARGISRGPLTRHHIRRPVRDLRAGRLRPLTARGTPMTTSTTTLSIPNLRAALAGRVVTADDPDYDDVRRVWPGNIDERPGLIVRGAHARDCRVG